MFSGATNFDQILNWDVGGVKHMTNMFSNATSFLSNDENWVQGVGKWKPEALTTDKTTNMFLNSNSVETAIHTEANAKTSECISSDGSILIIGNNDVPGFFFN